MDYSRPRNLSAIKADGTVAAADIDGNVTLPSNGTWFVPLGSANSHLVSQAADISAQIKWSAALAGAITLEWTDFPELKSGVESRGPVDVADNENAGTGFWVQDNDSTGDKISAVIGVGNSIAANTLTITAGGTNAGAIGVQLRDRSARRYRLKLVLTVAGVLRVGLHGKLGA